MIRSNTFAGAYVQRHAHMRTDPVWLETALNDPDTRFVPVWGQWCLAAGEPAHTVLLRRSEIEQWIDPAEIIFLGQFRDKAAFAVGIDREQTEPFSSLGRFQDLRLLGSTLPADEANLVAHARAMVIWSRAHRFCGHCGSPTRSGSAGNTRRCTNPDCDRTVFPRVDPAIIVLVHDGDRCLLGRQESWPEGRYSTIAGFVEPGESLEDAVAREVMEETDIDIGRVVYHSSQPWPFPSSLMLGFHAEARSTDIALTDGELEDARWFSRKEIASGYPKLSPRLSIARHLIDTWLEVAAPVRG